MKRALIACLVLCAAAANAATIRGKVTYPNGAPCAGAAAKAASPKGETTIAYSDREGMYYIHDVPAGHYTVNVTKGKTTKSVPVTVTNAPYADAKAISIQ